MYGPGSAAFRLHFNDERYGAPQVGSPCRRPGVRQFAHRCRWGDGINGNNFTQCMGYRGYGLIALECCPGAFLIFHICLQTDNAVRFQSNPTSINTPSVVT